MTQADSVHSTPPTNTPITHSRRGFLSRTMIALAAGAAVNASAVIATRPAASAAIVEDPVIIALGSVENQDSPLGLGVIQAFDG